MPIIEINQESNFVKCKDLKEKQFIVDTNFVINSTKGNLSTYVHERMEENECIFYQNVVVYQELIHHLFCRFVGELIDDGEQRKVNETRIKTVRQENLQILSKAIDKLKDELYEIKENFPYLSAFKFSKRPEWEDAERLIFENYLCPNDAMIANFVLSIDSIDGLITCDNDFRHCTEFEKREDKFLIIVKA